MLIVYLYELQFNLEAIVANWELLVAKRKLRETTVLQLLAIALDKVVHH